MLLEKINEQLTSVGAPVNAQFVYYANPDPPFNDGTALYFTALHNEDGSNYLPEGTHTFGNFGGSAKSTLFDQYNKNWVVYNSENVETGTIAVSQATVQGKADLSMYQQVI